MLIWFLPVFLVFLMIGLPVFFGLLAAPGILLWMSGQGSDITLLYRNVYKGMDSFPLMPFRFCRGGHLCTWFHADPCNGKARLYTPLCRCCDGC